MAITTLQIDDFRNLSAVLLMPCQHGLNLIHGQNGSGKTSILEAIYYMGLGRSFRSSSITRLIRQEADKFRIFAQLMSDSERQIPIGIERDIKGIMRLRVAESEATSMAELAAFLPMLVINSYCHDLFEAGPDGRRKFLDWGLFYQSDQFLGSWRQFERILKQRNVLLRDKQPKREIDAWTDELVKVGLRLDQLRQEYVRALLPFIRSTCELLLPDMELDIHYIQGWDQEVDYLSALEAAFFNDYKYGYTQYGPHRADLGIHTGGVPVKHFLSRGQQKLLACAMIIAQGKLLTSSVNKAVIYLVDDLPAELDENSRMKLISLLSAQSTQVFITAIEKETICDAITHPDAIPLKVFHVEHGNIAELAM